MNAQPALSFENSFLYEECTIPAGMTLSDWRRDARGPHPARRSVLRSVLGRLVP